MNLQQLRYFLASIEHGSFSAAADALFLAQPSLSEQIRRLEDELGVALFVRAGRGLALTEAGERFRPHAEHVLAELEEARETVAEVRELRGGLAQFGTFGASWYYILADLVADFRARHPDVRVRVTGVNSAETADAVREGRLEAGLVVLPIDDRGLEVRPALRDEVLYVSCDAERTRRPVTIEQLAAAPLILFDARYGTEDPTRRQLAERAQRAGVTLEPLIDIEDVAAAIELAARGVGDTLAPRGITIRRRFPRRLRSVSFAEPLYDTFAFITRRGARPSPAARAFIGIAEERLDALAARLEAAGGKDVRPRAAA